MIDRWSALTLSVNPASAGWSRLTIAGQNRSRGLELNQRLLGYEPRPGANTLPAFQTKKAARFSPGGLLEALASPRFLAAWHIFFTFGVCMRIETEPEGTQPQTNHAIGTELICAGRARRPATRQHAGGSYGRYASGGSGHHRRFPVSCGSAAVSPSLSPPMTATFRRVNPR